MRWPRKTALSLTCALAVSSCASGGAQKCLPVPEIRPSLPPLPAEMLRSPNFEQRVRDELLEPAPRPTPGLAGSSAN